MKQDWWRKDSPGVDAVKRSWALRKGKPTEDDAPAPQTFPGSKAERLPGQLSLDDKEHDETR